MTKTGNRRATQSWQFRKEIDMLVRSSGFPMAIHKKYLQLKTYLKMELLMVTYKRPNPRDRGAPAVHRSRGAS